MHRVFVIDDPGKTVPTVWTLEHAITRRNKPSEVIQKVKVDVLMC